MFLHKSLPLLNSDINQLFKKQNEIPNILVHSNYRMFPNVIFTNISQYSQNSKLNSAPALN